MYNDNYNEKFEDNSKSELLKLIITFLIIGIGMFIIEFRVNNPKVTINNFEISDIVYILLGSAGILSSLFFTVKLFINKNNIFFKKLEEKLIGTLIMLSFILVPTIFIYSYFTENGFSEQSIMNLIYYDGLAIIILIPLALIGIAYFVNEIIKPFNVTRYNDQLELISKTDTQMIFRNNKNRCYEYTGEDNNFQLKKCYYVERTKFVVKKINGEAPPLIMVPKKETYWSKFYSPFFGKSIIPLPIMYFLLGMFLTSTILTSNLLYKIYPGGISILILYMLYYDHNMKNGKG